MSIKLIALDLDGTTLNKQSVISEKTKAALEAAAAAGVNIVVATGRPFVALPDDIYEIDAIRYVITSNGAAIKDLKENKIIYRNCMSSEAALVAVKLLRELQEEYPLIYETFTDGTAYIEGEYYNEVKRTHKSFRNPDYIINTRIPVDDIFAFMTEHCDTLENTNVNFNDMSIKEKVREKLLTIPGATITSSIPNNLEIGGATTSKASALSHMSEVLGVSKDEIMAAGDSPNDIEMLKAAGLAIAMGNAEDEVKEVCDYVTLPNYDDGVAAAIEKFVLNK